MQAATPSPDGGKSTWRRWFRERLRGIDHPDRQAAAVRRHLEAHLAQSQPSRIGAFAAMPGEIDLRPLVAGSRHQWHFPRIEGDDLAFRHVGAMGDLEPDAYGIDAPVPNRPIVDISSLDLILVPGLGFGRDGSRLGRGRGYYDRTLGGVRPGTPLIAVACREQVVDRVPTEAHDLPVTHLLTPDGLVAVP